MDVIRWRTEIRVAIVRSTPDEGYSSVRDGLSVGCPTAIDGSGRGSCGHRCLVRPVVSQPHCESADRPEWPAPPKPRLGGEAI
jgi:hypothetical protein